MCVKLKVCKDESQKKSTRFTQGICYHKKNHNTRNVNKVNTFELKCNQQEYWSNFIKNNILDSNSNTNWVLCCQVSHLTQSQCARFCTYRISRCFASLSTFSPSPHASVFLLICNFHVAVADLTIPSLNYISIPATVVLVTAAMVTSQSLQVEWPECGPWLPDVEREEKNRTNPFFMNCTHTHWLKNSGG